jgi:Zn-dependent oligopeptidase
MHVLKKLGILLSIVPFAVSAQNPMLTNPLLVHSNRPIPFDKIDAPFIKEATSTIIEESNKRVKAITTIPAGKKTLQNTLMAFDELNYDLFDLTGKLSVISSTYSNDATRNEANEQLEKLESYESGLYLDELLYKALKAFSLEPGAKTLTSTQKKFLRENVTAFEINGMKLDKQGRENLKLINNKIIDFSNQFDKNIAEFKDSIEFTAADLKGVPDDYMHAWKRPDGNYMLNMNGPNYNNIITYADVEAIRRTIYMKYQNRAYPANITTLDSLLFYRQELADQLGYKTYAEYALVTKMAAKPANVWHFLDDLQARLNPRAARDVADLTALKQQQYPGKPDTVQAWDYAYYNNKLLNTKYKLDNDEVKEYFEMNNTIKGMFTVYEKLFNLKFIETSGQPVWNNEMKSYELYMDGKKMGSFYFDLYPRANKYTHFETAPISQYRIANGHEVLPVGVLICNFPEGTATQPSLLYHSDVVTMFHEFGHLMHFLLCHPVIASQNSFSTKDDFVEAPSQFLENFPWNYDVLKLFAKNYKTGEVMPRALFDKMKATEKVGVSWYFIRQVALAKLDFTYEDRYNTIKNGDIDQVEKDLLSMEHIPYPDGSHYICSFTHLTGYGANVYGYLWSKVFAQDIFSVFEKQGVLNTTTGVRYRKDILQPGAQEEESDMLVHFLGRKPNSAAFLRSLGIN